MLRSAGRGLDHLSRMRWRKRIMCVFRQQQGQGCYTHGTGRCTHAAAGIAGQARHPRPPMHPGRSLARWVSGCHRLKAGSQPKPVGDSMGDDPPSCTLLVMRRNLRRPAAGAAFHFRRRRKENEEERGDAGGRGRKDACLPAYERDRSEQNPIPITRGFYPKQQAPRHGLRDT